jgi:antibiotic biosynthesis monooxygenase (ABM) superfamily enzyme
MTIKRVSLALAVVALVAAAFAAGHAVAKQPINQPDTLIHHVALKWKETATEADKQKVIYDLKGILADVPGAKNLWTKAIKVQPGSYSQTFVIEFENEDALKAYANHPDKKAWNELYYGIREESRNCVTSN